MKRQSEQDTARRARRRELFAARMCLQDCGRPAARGSNLCARCDRALCDRYFARLNRRATKETNR